MLMTRVRPARVEDREAIWRVHTSSIREVCKTHYSEDEIQAWTGLLNPDSYNGVLRTREMVVAEEEDTVVGFGQLNLQTSEVEAVYVSPRVLGRGVGSEILSALEDVARQHDLRA